MTYPTVPAFAVATSGFTPDLLAHPALQFIKAHEDDMHDQSVHKSKPYFASGFVLTKSTGQVISGPGAAEAWYADLAMFASHVHEPKYVVVTELDGGKGYRVFAHAKIYVDLVGGKGTDDEKTATDDEGRKWELVLGGTMLTDLVRDEGGVLGFKFASVKLYYDPTPALGLAIKRGLIPVEALA